ncbi:MAG: serine/threonine-protein kinase [Kofleriaceae bacterium]|nr:serine/threonine-protein kinase [Kofleriaceae bacterium]
MGDPEYSQDLGLLTESGGTVAPTSDTRAAPSRYALGGELGAGGMGRVRTAYDATLEREIAVKQVRLVGDASAEATLLREARVTARLDHPSIIAVLDAGEDAEGRVFYAMRIVHGHGLDEVVAAGTEHRTGLLRAVLQVAQAIAYAHARGVVHRDLSPRNIRLGAHGEVVVIDWGLAAMIDELRTTRVVCGTPGYRAPELAAGQPAGPQADVWSLGALLHLVLFGTPPSARRSRRGVPAELRSLLACALATDPARRYADAGELARDIAAFLDGGRLRAHRDRPWDRVARLARRRPGVLGTASAGIAIVALVALLLGGHARRAAETARAAQAQARAAQEDANAALRDMVLDRAWQSTRLDRRPDAESLARRARELGAPIGARGVFAAFEATAQQGRTPLWPDDGCEVRAVRDRHTRLCTRAGRAWLVSSAARISLPIAEDVLAARFLGDGRLIVVVGTTSRQTAVVLDGQLREEARHVLSGGQPTIHAGDDTAIIATAQDYHVLARGAMHVVHPCAPGMPLRFLAPLAPSPTAPSPNEPAVIALCPDGKLVRADAAGKTSRDAFELGARIPAASAAVALGAHLFIGGIDARLGLVELATGRVVYATRSPVGGIRQVLATGEQDVVLVGEDGVALWDASAGAARAVTDTTGAEVTRDGVIAWGARGGELWPAPAARRLHRVTMRGGISAVAFAPDGASLAFGDGSGQLALVTLDAGTVRRRSLGDQVVKSIVFSPDGAMIAGGLASAHGARVFDPATLTARPGPWEDPVLGIKRLAYLAPDTLLALRYSKHPVAFNASTGARIGIDDLTGLPLDVAQPADGTALVVLGVDGETWRREGTSWRALAPLPGASAIAITENGAVVAIASGNGETIELRDAVTDARLGQVNAPGARIEDLALDRTGARLAIARIDGTVEVHSTSDGATVLALVAHDGRAAAVAFSPDGCWLATGGWDAVGRLLALCTAETAPPTSAAR